MSSRKKQKKISFGPITLNAALVPLERHPTKVKAVTPDVCSIVLSHYCCQQWVWLWCVLCANRTMGMDQVCPETSHKSYNCAPSLLTAPLADFMLFPVGHGYSSLGLCSVLKDYQIEWKPFQQGMRAITKLVSHVMSPLQSQLPVNLLCLDVVSWSINLEMILI